MKGCCNREDCFAYTGELENNCDALTKCYHDNFECPFYKPNTIQDKWDPNNIRTKEEEK